MRYTSAIIGCGRIGSEYSDDPRIKGIYSHAEAYSVSDQTDLVAVCDTSPEKLEKCRSRWNVRYGFSDYMEMLREVHPEIVSICTPDPTHYSVVKDVLNIGGARAILTEKPLAMSISESREIVSLAAETGVVLAVNYPRRYAINHQRVRTAIQDEHLLGVIQKISGFYSKGTLHSGTHWFDLARFLLGEISSVRGFDTIREKSPDPTLDAWLKFANGATGFLHGCNEDAYSIFEMDIIGTKGRVHIRDSGNLIDYYLVADDPYYSGYKALQLTKTDQDGLGDVILHAVNDLVYSFENGTLPLCSGHDGIKAIEIASAVQRSIPDGHEISL